MNPAETSASLKRELGVFSTTLLVAGNMIGIGIFVTAGRIYQLLPNPTYILLAWIFGGVLSLCGALSYAEMGTRFPRAGGPYIYLRSAFGPLWGFLCGFSAGWVSLPGATAFLAIGFTRYAGIDNPVVAKVVAVSLILLFSYINYCGVKLGARLQDGFMVLKLSLIAILVIAGFFSSNGSWANFALSRELTRPLWEALPLALVPILYTYSGWDATTYIAGEVKDPQKTIPRSLFGGAFLVTFVYVSLACLYLYAIAATGENPQKIVAAASSVLLGPTVGAVVGWLVAISILGALSATILTAPRVLFAMAQDKLLPEFAARVSTTKQTPSAAIWLMGLWSCGLALTGTFDQLLDYVTVPCVFFNALVVIGLIRVRLKDHKDPSAQIYSIPAFPWIPILFALSALWIVIMTIIKTPMDSIWGLVIVSLGIPVYYWQKKRVEK